MQATHRPSSFRPPSPRPAPVPPSAAVDDDPVRLWADVVAAREGLAEHRRNAPNSATHAAARREFLISLEAYAASIAVRRRPLPYVLRDELRLLRLTCSADRYA